MLAGVNPWVETVLLEAIDKATHLYASATRQARKGWGWYAFIISAAWTAIFYGILVMRSFEND